MSPLRHNFLSGDGVRLSWLEAGSGPTLIMLPGWSQSAALFREQFAGLSGKIHCLSLDHRGHGESDKPSYGYRISRLAQDLRELIDHCELDQITLLGHSMGSSVIWAYLDAYGEDRLAGLVIDDQPPAMTLLEHESDVARKHAGAIFPWPQLNATCAELSGPKGAAARRQMIGAMLSNRISKVDRDWILGENDKFPSQHAATLLFNSSTQDWRDLIPRITLPTLIIGGEGSVVPPESQRWIHSQLRRSQVEILPSDQGGYHFGFLENPRRFNELVGCFISSNAAAAITSG